MRIGMISTYPPIECGIATYAQYLTDALRQQHTDVYVVSHVGGNGYQVFPAFDYEDPDLAEKAFSTMIRFTPDVVHIQHEFGLFGKDYGVNVIPLIIKFRLVGVPVVTTLHTVYDHASVNHLLLLDSILSNSNHVLVHSDFQKNVLIEKVRANPDKVSVIPHGAREVSPIPDAKKKLGLPPDKKVILIIGYFRPSKNFELIVDLLPEILSRYPQAILVIAGKIRGKEHLDYRNMLFHKIETSPVRNHIFLMRGQLPQKVFDTILSCADVVVLPYQISSQSGILAHALAFHRPVVTSDSLGVRTVIEQAQAGLVARSSQDFVNQIVSILSDEALANRLSENARNFVRSQIGWSLVAKKHLDIYRSVMETPVLESRIIWVD